MSISHVSDLLYNPNNLRASFWPNGLQDLDEEPKITDAFSGGITSNLEGRRGLVINTKMTGFGDTAVVFKNSPEFIRRFARAIENIPTTGKHGFVEYDADTLGKHHAPLHKKSRFRHENEYRFVVDPVIVPGERVPESINLHLGSLRDIAFLGDVSKIRPINVPHASVLK